MSSQTILFFLLLVIAALVFVILYQRFVFRKGIQAKLGQISRKLEEISGSDSDEKVMVFTDSPALLELAGEINRLLVDRQRIKAEFKRGELSSKKMLANISHDIKTPLTVILGYLEIVRLADTDNEMLKKVETKAKQVMDLITQFFTLAKLEAGDADIPLSRINISEICIVIAKEIRKNWSRVLKTNTFIMVFRNKEIPFGYTCMRKKQRRSKEKGGSEYVLYLTNKPSYEKNRWQRAGKRCEYPCEKRGNLWILRTQRSRKNYGDEDDHQSVETDGRNRRAFWKSSGK